MNSNGIHNETSHFVFVYVTKMILYVTGSPTVIREILSINDSKSILL